MRKKLKNKYACAQVSLLFSILQMLLSKAPTFFFFTVGTISMEKPGVKYSLIKSAMVVADYRLSALRRLMQLIWRVECKRATVTVGTCFKGYNSVIIIIFFVV